MSRTAAGTTAPSAAAARSDRLSGPVRVSWVKRLWRKLPFRVREAAYRALTWTGLPYLLSYIAGYGATHSAANFAGNLIPLRDEYPNSTRDRKQRLAHRFDAIVDALVLPNGVRRTTYPARQNAVVERVLADEACRPNTSELRVLDLPASSGIASLGTLDLLSRQYRVGCYVLADLSFQALYDPERGCIFDEQGHLLQVQRRKRFFSIYRPHASGNEVSVLTNLLLLPLTVASWHLKRKFRFSAARDLLPVRLIHPEVEARLDNGVLALKKVDVFQDLGDQYDLILSFNLLQRNYFSAEAIARGMENLRRGLRDGGVLVMGSPDVHGSSAFLVARRRGGDLVIVRREGRF